MNSIIYNENICIFGNLINNTICECYENFVYDQSYFQLYNSCRPLYSITFGGIISCLISLLFLYRYIPIFNYHKQRGKKQLQKIFLYEIITEITGFMSGLMMIIFDKANIYFWIFISLQVIFVSLGFQQLVFSFCNAQSKTSNKKFVAWLNFFKKQFSTSHITSVIPYAAITIMNGLYIYNKNDSIYNNNSYYYNITILIVTILNVLVILAFYPAVIIISNRLIEILTMGSKIRVNTSKIGDHSSTSSSSSKKDNYNKSTLKFIKNIETIKNSKKYLLPVTIVPLYCILSIFTIGTVPLQIIELYVIGIYIHFFSYIVYIFGEKSNVENKSNSPTINNDSESVLTRNISKTETESSQRLSIMQSKQIPVKE